MIGGAEIANTFSIANCCRPTHGQEFDRAEPSVRMTGCMCGSFLIFSSMIILACAASASLGLLYVSLSCQALRLVLKTRVALLKAYPVR